MPFRSPLSGRRFFDFSRLLPAFFSNVLLACLLGSLPTSASAAVTCTFGKGLLATAQELLGYQKGAETLDDINVGLGLIPDALISENVRKISDKSIDAVKQLQEIQELCYQVLVLKDPVEQYFYALDKLFGASPVGALVSIQTKMGRAILSNAKAIMANTVTNALTSDAIAGLTFTIELSRYRRLLWNAGITGQELRSANHVTGVRMISKSKITGDHSIQNLGPTYESDYPVRIMIGDGIDFIAQGQDPANSNYFVEIHWRNGQVSMVPVAPNYYDTANKTVIFPFVIRDGSYYLNK